MKITDADDTWRSVTTTVKEIWDIHYGAIVVDTDPVAAARLGVRLNWLGQNTSLEIPAETTVYYKLHTGTSAEVARVAL